MSELEIGSRALGAPSFFASVSSIKQSLLPVEEVEILGALRAETFLVSAYDFVHSRSRDSSSMVRAVEKARSGGAIALLDSGNYESYWHRDASWTRAQFHEAAIAMPCDGVFTYDEAFQGHAHEIVARIVEGVNRDREALTDLHLIPIVHVAGAESSKAVDILTAVALELSVSLIAVPERELGDGITNRSYRIRAIQTAMQEAGLDTRIHILGTGNPLSLLAYSVAGADSFDGLEWCHTVVDHLTGLLFHFQQYDFFRAQTPYGDGALPLSLAGRAHNLTFLREWFRILREGRKLGDLESAFLSDYVGSEKGSTITRALTALLASLSRSPSGL